MATLVTVHGTYAQEGSTPPGEPQWWQAGSTFDQEVQALVEAPGAKLEVERFKWSGENSEIARRDAGHKLFLKLKELEARKEPFCIVGHSHGGSVISAALLESAARKEPLRGLKRWISIGTPFVNLRRERLLFARLDLPRKVIFVASLMLLLMFMVYFMADLFKSGSSVIGVTVPQVFLTMAIMMSLPALATYLLFKYLDSRTLLHYRRAVKARARDWFGNRWLSLTHADDEAVQGLTVLPATQLSFFDRTFAVSSITVLSVIALPLIYLSVLASPVTMMALADWLRTTVYEAKASPEAEKAILDMRKRLSQSRTQSQRTAPTGTPTKSTAPSAEQREAWSDFRAQRRALEAKYPEYRSTERALRFRQRFFEREGKPCEGGKLCGMGHDLRVNSGLLLHVVTDEVSWALGVEAGGGNWQTRWLLSLLLPALLVPVIFGVLALVIMLAIRAIAHLVSQFTSHALNNLTNAEVKRAAFGNDTEGEIALGAADRPVWIDRSPPRLPAVPAEIITQYSNSVASRSLDKLRRAIGQFAATDTRQSTNGGLASYFTWRELVHGAYFDVPEFRKMVAQAISSSEGFAPTAAFQADPDFARTVEWIVKLEEAQPKHQALVAQPGSTAQPA